MDHLLSDRNLDRCRRLLEPSLDAAERRQILEQLALEAELLRQDFRVGRLPYEYGGRHGSGAADRAA
jgi:hypothetical protein